MVTVPRTVIAAGASSQGKTTVAVGLMAALRRAGYRVAPFKVGPDYIDPGYHFLATGRAGRNLDPWLCSEDQMKPLLLHGFSQPEPADVAVIEGVMGLYDGRLGTDGFASTAHIAKITQSPVILVVDISSATRTVAAIVHGLRTFDPDVQIAGVILNKAGSARHATEVRRSMTVTGVPVLGILPRDAGVSVPSRHLGLLPAAERPQAVQALDKLTDQNAEFVDLAAILQIAATAPEIAGPFWEPPVSAVSGPPVMADRPVVSVAGGRSFTFRYAETDELLRALGVEPVFFDPAVDRELPSGVCGLYLGGGFPEVHAAALSTNRALLAEVRDAVRSGLPTVAECAGMLYLAESVGGHQFSGIVPTRAEMQTRLTLAYRDAQLATDSILGPAGARVRGHELHYTTVEPSAGAAPAWNVDGVPEGFALDPSGAGRATVHASYLHVHWAGYPDLAVNFAEVVRATQSSVRVAEGLRLTRVLPASTEPISPPRADHHGDDEITSELIDFAVNVRVTEPTDPVASAVRNSFGELAAYPKICLAREALARYHGVPPEFLLPTAGAAEAFTLIARAVDAKRPVVVHPQFSEPDNALRAAGRVVDALLLSPVDGFRLDATALPVPEDADLVFVGNPTNPTGVLHLRATLQALRRPGRVLVVDEAFMDCVVQKSDSMISSEMDGLLVVCSLTKSWGIAGLRAGYVVGDVSLITRLAAQQPHWAVNTPATAAMQAAVTPAAVLRLGQLAERDDLWREHLVAGLAAIGVTVIDSAAPFVLAQPGPGVHAVLCSRGYAVRRCDTFPGLDDSWVRLTVRDPLTTDGLLREIADITRTLEGMKLV